MKNRTRKCTKTKARIMCSAVAFCAIALSFAANADTVDSTTTDPMGVANSPPSKHLLHEKIQEVDRSDVGESSRIVATLNINSASVVELAKTLPGIGMQKAQRIVEWRRSNGLFEYKDQLLEIPGIGVKTLERIQNYFHLGESDAAMFGGPDRTIVDKKTPVLGNIVLRAISDANRVDAISEGG